MAQDNTDKVAKYRARKALMEDVDPEELAATAGQVAHEAWKQVKIMKAHQHKNFIRAPGCGDAVPFGWLNVRQKQRAMSDWMLSMSATSAMREAYAKAALLDPIAHMKIVVSLMPKELEVQVSGNVGIVVLPAKVGSTQEWVDMATGKEPKGEILDAEAVSAADTWRKLQEGDGEVDG